MAFPAVCAPALLTAVWNFTPLMAAFAASERSTACSPPSAISSLSIASFLISEAATPSVAISLRPTALVMISVLPIEFVAASDLPTALARIWPLPTLLRASEVAA